MAGRAGRRGLDSTGTVIILVKDKVYESDELQRMMLGKPTRLESKFKLTYSMILNLFKVRQLRVEDMMKRSFSEKDSQKNQSVYKERISKLKKEIVKNNDVGLERLYDQVEHFFKIRNPYWTKLFSLASIQKSLILGRIVLVHSDGVFKYGCILRVNQVVTPRTYDVFIYKPKTDVISMVNDEFSLFVNFVRRKQPIWDPLTTGYTKDYCYVTLRDIDIMEITKKVIKNIDSQKIIDDIKRREIPRFSDCPPGVSSMNVLQELSKFSHENQCISSCTSILNPLKDFKIQDIDDIEDCCKLKSIYESNVDEDVTSIDFTDRFKNVYEEKKKMKEVENLDFLLSDSSLKFLPDFNNRVDVLNKLQYISSDKIVKLKGRVASKMSNHELLVTELIFRKVITDRPSEEIASLLSCIVFKNKKCSEPELTQSLKEGIEEIKDIARVIGTAQKDAGFDEPVEQYVDNFCFGLTEVVYEWAKGLPFSEIIKLTDVHEGTIVNTIQMLDEVIRNIKDAALFDIGDPILKQKNG
ncbi:SKI2 [Lepeophtheirus salmonis]|uniref:SKI2 n=1 Tax=Lepeophtheirus salmonis TaxID=72036 RepID=A0A7R8D133_LEPSM|nr:SKI2 [Lepeophtheirus salmonis]CAF2989493.1 SKI2 [Lepeophtheirus salmonis]